MSFGMFQLKFWSKARRGAVLGSCYWGSGDILVVKSSDKVEVGDANAFMMLSCGKKRRFQWFPMIPPYSKMFFFGVPQVLGRVSKAQFWLPWCLVPPLQSGQFFPEVQMPCIRDIQGTKACCWWWSRFLLLQVPEVAACCCQLIACFWNVSSSRIAWDEANWGKPMNPM